MASLTDEDGIDGPFEKEMDRVIANDARRRRDSHLRDALRASALVTSEVRRLLGIAPVRTPAQQRADASTKTTDADHLDRAIKLLDEARAALVASKEAA